MDCISENTWSYNYKIETVINKCKLYPYFGVSLGMFYAKKLGNKKYRLLNSSFMVDVGIILLRSMSAVIG